MQRLNIAGLACDCITQFRPEMAQLFGEYQPGGQSAATPVPTAATPAQSAATPAPTAATPASTAATPAPSAATPARSEADLVLDPRPWRQAIEAETEQSPESIEFYALSVALGEQLPLYRRLQTHGVAIEYEGRAYIFAAPSGTGKSTRAFLWQKYLQNVTIVNGDKPILWFKDDEILACGSPWAGKEGLQTNVCVPLGGICLLRRSPDNTIRPAGAQEFFDFYSTQVQMPQNPEAMLAALSLLDELYAKVPVFVLENDMSEQGVKVAFEALTQKPYKQL